MAHAMVELPADPDVVLLIIHEGMRFVSVPVHRSFLTGDADVAEAVRTAIDRADQELQGLPRLYRGAPGERY